ncbi:Lysophospholipid transporter LplT [Klebsiella grimontii]|nr:Lysophospholipid transporter LplT [Klebsiella grimontii]
MSESVHTNGSLYSKGMMAVICAQFLSAFGDNALLFATLALMKQLFYPEWSQPVLQMLFVGAYILFAPFVGQFADSFAKGRVMMAANGLKLVGAGCICFGVNPFIGYTLVGIGAAAYSPAKYGILGELTTGDKLVKANGLDGVIDHCGDPAWLNGGRYPRRLARRGGAQRLRGGVRRGGGRQPVDPEAAGGSPRTVVALQADDPQLL